MNNKPTRLIFFWVVLAAALASFVYPAHSQPNQRAPRYYGEKTTAQINATPCFPIVFNQVYDITLKVPKYCSATNTWTPFGGGEPTIAGSTSDKFWDGTKTFRNILQADVTGLKTTDSPVFENVTATPPDPDTDALVGINWTAGSSFGFRYKANQAVAFVETSYPATSGQPWGDIVFRLNTSVSPFEILRLSAYSQEVVVSGKLVIPSQPPASASATGRVGTITWDANYIYICTATDTWERVAIASW